MIGQGRYFWACGGNTLKATFPQAYKLIPADFISPILGLLRVGNVTDGIPALKQNLLETVPVYRRQWNAPPAAFRGVGCVLVARLVVASYNQGVGGAVRVRSHQNAGGFYSRIGFTLINPVRRVYEIFPANAGALFQKATL